MNRIEYVLAGLLIIVNGCGTKEVRPVDIYPEDMCAFCRMVVSDQRFAAEIIVPGRDVWKFDDIRCMEAFRDRSPNAEEMVVFVKDYTTQAWVPAAEATIVATSIPTPMGSGRVGFADSTQAAAFQKAHPPVTEGVGQ